MADLKRTQLKVERERAVLCGVLLPDHAADPRDPLGELASLARTAGAQVVAQILQRRPRPDPGTFCGTGKAIEIADLALKNRADVILFDNDLSPAQIGSLEKIVNKHANKPLGQGIKVLDRSELILDIFASRAQTHEARLQVELAQMQYTYPRLTRMWGHLERLAGGGGSLGIGTRGPGETQLEIDRRLVRKRISDLRREIDKVHARKSRAVERRNRLNHTICVVGYTNAGKSTLFNTLTAAGTYADDKLFATLDTKTRAWSLEGGLTAMLSDTVGFVRDLPHMLVASFRATLEEAVHADLLLHVLDISHPRAEQQFQSVHQVLCEIGAAGKPEILLLNKADRPEAAEQAAVWKTLHPDALVVSAKTGLGLGSLADRVLQHLRRQHLHATLEIDPADGRLLALIERNARVITRRVEPDAVIFELLLDHATLDSLAGQTGVRRVTTDQTCVSPSPAS